MYTGCRVHTHFLDIRNNVFRILCPARIACILTEKIIFVFFSL